MAGATLASMAELLIFGLGELGKLYGAGALGAGFRVTPVLRSTPIEPIWSTLPAGVPLLIAVSEPSLPAVLQALPASRFGDAILLQNEIFPSLWAHAPEAPTVMIPWLLKKKGLPQIVIRSTPVFGRHAAAVVAMHEALGLESKVLESSIELAHALAHKYTFILTINALGVWRDQSLGRWLDEDLPLVRDLASEASSLASRLVETEIDTEIAIDATLEGMQAMQAISARGRSATIRVTRAQNEAKRLGLALPLLSQIGV